MAEGGNANIEIAHHLSAHHESSTEHRILETVEAVVLAIVAILTAWSGYQAALWNGHQAELYSIAGKLRVQAEGATTTANQERLYNSAGRGARASEACGPIRTASASGVPSSL
jgi:hypothetical protein